MHNAYVIYLHFEQNAFMCSWDRRFSHFKHSIRVFLSLTSGYSSHLLYLVVLNFINAFELFVETFAFLLHTVREVLGKVLMLISDRCSMRFSISCNANSFKIRRLLLHLFVGLGVESNIILAFIAATFRAEKKITTSHILVILELLPFDPQYPLLPYSYYKKI